MLNQLEIALPLAVLVAAFCVLAVVVLVMVWRPMRTWPPLTLPETKRESEKSALSSSGSWLFAGFSLFWSLGVLYCDVDIVRRTVTQWRALDYSTVEGEVSKCQVKRTGDEETADVDIEYVYQVENLKYASDRVRCLKLWGPAWVSRFVASHPARSQVTVFYDPEDPASAMLLPGLAGQELVAPLFLLPFNMVMLFMWCAFACLKPRENVLPLGVCIMENEENSCIRLPSLHPAVGGLGTLTVGSFFGALIVFLSGGMPPYVTVMVVVWSFVLGAATLGYLMKAMPVASGKADLVIDHLHKKTVTLPQTFGRKQPVVVPLADLQAIRVVGVEETDSDGDTKRV